MANTASNQLTRNMTNTACHQQERASGGNMANMAHHLQDTGIASNIADVSHHMKGNISTTIMDNMAHHQQDGLASGNVANMAPHQENTSIPSNMAHTAQHQQNNARNVANMTHQHQNSVITRNMAHMAHHNPDLKRKIREDDVIQEYHAPKRISPFHNTPIQKKETKRRILKMSLRKMRTIQCPETFLRRSVLINNLARSLQDDLKDDKLWDRWGWECDLDPVPFRQPHSLPNRTLDPGNIKHGGICNCGATCTGGAPCGNIKQAISGVICNCGATCTSGAPCGMLSNTCMSSSNQWTVSPDVHSNHGNWLNGVDDAHLSPSERERVTRDLAQSHDRLAQTVENLTSSFQDAMFHPPSYCHNNDVTMSKPPTNAGGIITCSCDSVQGMSSLGLPDNSVHKSDINKNQLMQCNLHSVPSASDSSLSDAWFSTSTSVVSVACSGLDAWPSLPTNVTTGTPATFSSSLTDGSIFSTTPPQSEASNPATSSHPMLSCDLSLSCDPVSSAICPIDSRQLTVDKLVAPGPQSWTSCSSFGIDDAGPTYLDMTSNSFCRGTTDLALLDSVDISSVPHLTPHSSSVAMEIATSETIGYSSADATDSTNMSTIISLTPSDSQWATPIDSSTLSTTSTLPPSPSGSCSTEAERPDGMTSLPQNQFPDQPDRFASHGLREFDVIYNNLVSVLIGGN